MLPEPWLRGPVEGVHPLTAPILYAFQQAREDLARYTEGLTPEQLWATPHGFGSVGFHLRHIAGSTERLMSYLEGRALSAEQMAVLGAEKEAAEADSAQLLALVERAFREAEAVVRAIDPSTLAEARTVGRMRLPTTVIGLLTHIAEHTQRHVGQAISAAKLARATSTELLFSYGTLQKKSVQLANFGRELTGRADALPGYTVRMFAVADPKVRELTGETHHASAEPRSQPEDAISGVVFEITARELAAADQYEEAAGYRRISVTLRSGNRAWVYVCKE